MGASLSRRRDRSGSHYRVAGTVATGRSHAAANTPCQDRIGSNRREDMAAIALADGAGSRARSEYGAAIAVRSALRLLTTQFDELYMLCEQDPAAARAFIHKRLMRALQRQAKRLQCDESALASTLLCAAHKGDRFVAAHLGDGVIARVNTQGVASTLSHPDNGEYANTTYFITDPSALNKIRLYHGSDTSDLAGLVLMSDGCAESLYEKSTGMPAQAVTKLMTWTQNLKHDEINNILKANMEQLFTRKSADDCSLILLSTPKRERPAPLRPAS